MAEEIEIEYKNLLTEDEFNNLLNKTQEKQVGQEIRQSNYYYDTPDLKLKDKNSALRIRIIEPHQAEMTLKTPYGEHLLETTEKLPYNLAVDLVKNHKLSLPTSIKQAIEGLDIPVENLVYQASMATHRQTFKQDRFEIVLDHSVYDQAEDYELEVEGVDAAECLTAFKRLLALHGIPKRPTDNKIARAYRYASSN